MPIDWQASKLEFVNLVRSTIVPRVLSDPRLAGADRAVRAFDSSVETWRVNQVWRPVANFANELIVADVLLRGIPADSAVEYEPRLANTPKKIDFFVRLPDGVKYWLEVKTVAPQESGEEAIDRLQEIVRDMPANTHVIADPQTMREMLKTRWAFIQHTLTFEERLRLLTAPEAAPSRLLFVSDKGSWREDHLEDFADFYHFRQARDDDPWRNAVVQYMQERNLTFARTISEFSYLRRRADEVRVLEFTATVRGPRLP